LPIDTRSYPGRLSCSNPSIFLLFLHLLHGKFLFLLQWNSLKRLWCRSFHVYNIRVKENQNSSIWMALNVALLLHKRISCLRSMKISCWKKVHPFNRFPYEKHEWFRHVSIFFLFPKYGVEMLLSVGVG
jgi:hypothetical protein